MADLAEDVLYGAAAIAKFMGMSRRTIYHAIYTGNMPHFHIGGTVCSRKSTLIAWIEKMESDAAHNKNKTS